MQTRRFLNFLLSVLTLSLLTGVSHAQAELGTEFFFPQIVDGRANSQEDDDDVFRTIIVLNNPTATDATNVSVELFLSDLLGNTVATNELGFRCLEACTVGPCLSRGQSLTAGDLQDFILPGNGFVAVITERSGPVQVQGYARVMSPNLAITGMAIFGQFEEEISQEDNEFEVEVEIEGQAAVLPTGRMRTFAITDFRRNELEVESNGLEFEFESESSTGLAVVNLGSEATTLTFTEYNAAGTVQATGTMSLAAGEHNAFFLEEILNVDLVVGMVVVESSTTDVTAVGLKFDEELDEDDFDQRFEFTVAPVTRIN